MADTRLPNVPLAAAAVLVTVTVLAGTPGALAAASSNPTSVGDGEGARATVVRRHLVDVRSEEGIVRSGGSLTVRSGWAAAVADGDGDSTEGDRGALLGTALVAATGEPTGDPTSSGDATDEPSGEPTSEPTGEPSDPTGDPTSEPTSDPTGDPTGDPTSEPTREPTRPTDPVPSATPVPPQTGAPGGDAGPPSGSPPGDGNFGGAGGAAPPGGMPQAMSGGPLAGSPVAAGGSAGEPDPDGAGVATSTVTALADPGAGVATGTVLHSVDGEAAVAVVSDTPLWRDLDADSAGGADVTVLEQALVDLGHGDGISVDEDFDADTGDAVERWEADLGRADPDGRVTVGDVVSVPAGTTVTRRVAAVGDRVATGASLLELGTGAQEIVVDIEADDLGPWRSGAAVVVTGATGELPATVVAIGTDAEGGGDAGTATVEVVTVPDVTAPDVPAPDASAQDDEAAAGAVLTTGSAVTVSVVVEEVSDAVTVPVSAIIAGPDDDPSVRTVAADGSVTTVPVSYGLVVGGLVEILDGLAEGTVVVLPG